MSRQATPSIIYQNHPLMRVQDATINPYNATGMVLAEFEKDGEETTWYGTGFQLDPTHIVTAAHIIYDHDLGEATSVAFAPALNTEDFNEGNFKACLNWQYPQQYRDAPLPTNPIVNPNGGVAWDFTAYKWDFAVLTLSFPAPIATPYTLWAAPASLTGQNVSIIGYPGEQLNGVNLYPAYPEGTMWRSNGPIRIDGNESPNVQHHGLLLHELSALRGMSGSAVMMNERLNPPPMNMACGIQIAENEDDGNIALKFTDAIVTQIMGWCQ